MKLNYTIIYISLTLMIMPIISGQEAFQNNGQVDTSELDNYTPPAPADRSSTYINYDNVTLHLEQIQYAKTMSIYILAYGAVLSLFSGIIALRTKGWSPEATKVFTVTVIVTAGLFLMTAGYTSEQIAPMYGLLGTIVGYLLGKANPSEQETQAPPSG